MWIQDILNKIESVSEDDLLFNPEKRRALEALFKRGVRDVIANRHDKRLRRFAMETLFNHCIRAADQRRAADSFGWFIALICCRELVEEIRKDAAEIRKFRRESPSQAASEAHDSELQFFELFRRCAAAMLCLKDANVAMEIGSEVKGDIIAAIVQTTSLILTREDDREPLVGEKGVVEEILLYASEVIVVLGDPEREDSHSTAVEHWIEPAIKAGFGGFAISALHAVGSRESFARFITDHVNGTIRGEQFSRSVIISLRGKALISVGASSRVNPEPFVSVGELAIKEEDLLLLAVCEAALISVVGQDVALKKMKAILPELLLKASNKNEDILLPLLVIAEEHETHSSIKKAIEAMAEEGNNRGNITLSLSLRNIVLRCDSRVSIDPSWSNAFRAAAKLNMLLIENTQLQDVAAASVLLLNFLHLDGPPPSRKEVEAKLKKRWEKLDPALQIALLHIREDQAIC